MLVPTPTISRRWPAAPYANGTYTSPPRTSPAPYLPNANAIDKPPAVIPAPQFEPVEVLPAASIPPAPTHAPVVIGIVADEVTFLQGYCSEPAYTIIDGPTAVWMPVVGCMSTKGDCCPTPPVGNAVGSEEGHTQDMKKGGQFLASQLPSQGTLTGCPRDYHTVDGTACCPSNYWLWSTNLGGQVPCYSSLVAAMTPPPIPDTMVNQLDATDSPRETLTRDRVITTTASDGRVFTTTIASSRVPALTMSQKPTSAIVNIVYTMQYPMVPPKSKMNTGAKIGIGVGASGAAILIGFVLWFFIRTTSHRGSKKKLQSPEQVSVSRRFGSGVDMSRVAHQPAGVERVYNGKQYAGASSSATAY